MEYLVTHPEIAAAMGQAGHHRVTRFTWDTFTRRIDDYVDALTMPVRSTEVATPVDRQLNLNR